VNAKLQKARIGLLLDEPFFGALLLNLKISEQPGIGTMATDSVRLVCDPKFIDSLSPIELKTVLAHEALHCALLHPLRRGDRDPKQWNVAIDYAANCLLAQTNEAAIAKGRPAPFKFPKGGLVNSAYNGLSAEAIYGQLAQQPQPDPNGNQPGQGQGKGQGKPAPSNDPGGMGGVEDYPGKTEAEESAQEARWKVALSQAASMGEGRGDLPGDLARLIGDILNPKADWRELLRRFIRDRARDDYAWSRPNPRYLQSGFILPSLDSQRLGTIAVAIDTSGSINPDLLNAFMTEVESIVHEARPNKLLLIDCDAAINSVRTFEPGDVLPRDFAGGGGTDFNPVFELLDQDDPPAALVYLTDLDGRFPAFEPGYPVIWAATSASSVPWGEIVRLQ
jgi:predicted metal-dependent peptidase